VRPAQVMLKEVIADSFRYLAWNACSHHYTCVLWISCCLVLFLLCFAFAPLHFCVSCYFFIESIIMYCSSDVSTCLLLTFVLNALLTAAYYYHTLLDQIPEFDIKLRKILSLLSNVYRQ